MFPRITDRLSGACINHPQCLVKNILCVCVFFFKKCKSTAKTDLCVLAGQHLKSIPISTLQNSHLGCMNLNYPQRLLHLGPDCQLMDF